MWMGELSIKKCSLAIYPMRPEVKDQKSLSGARANGSSGGTQWVRQVHRNLTAPANVRCTG